MIGQRLATSSFVRECLARMDVKGGRVLDLPSGSGRHSTLLSSQGFQVVAADIDRSLLVSLLGGAPGSEGGVAAVQLDGTSALPFRGSAFDLVIVVHPPFLAVLHRALPVVRPGGCLLFESFGAQGGNGLLLPRAGQVCESLSADFETIIYREKPVREPSTAVTVKGLFRRRPVPQSAPIG